MITIARHNEGRPLADPSYRTMSYLFDLMKVAGLKVQGNSQRFEAEDAQGNIYVIELKE